MDYGDVLEKMSEEIADRLDREYAAVESRLDAIERALEEDCKDRQLQDKLQDAINDAAYEQQRQRW